MNVVVHHAFGQNRAAPAVQPRIARVEVIEDMAAAEPVWRALEQADALTTPYQHYDLLALWQQHVGAAIGVTPFIVAAYDEDGEPLCLLPFGRRKRGPFQVIEFLGGKHASFNVALWRRDIVASITADDLRFILKVLNTRRVDALLLQDQSLTWQGTTNPFALLPHQRAPNFGYSGALTPDFETVMRTRTNAAARKKMRAKERKLAEHGAVRFERVTEAADARRVLDAFFKQKSARMGAKGQPDVFAAPDVRRFLEAAAADTLATTGTPVIELYALSVDDIVVAIMGGITGGGRFCGMFNSIIHGRFAAESPGEQLIVNIVRTCCERSLVTFDLGVGKARYKGLFCPDAEILFNSFIALSVSGLFIASAMRTLYRFKHFLKQNPTLWAGIETLRRARAKIAALRH